MIRLFASDLDGTLFNWRHMLDDTIRHALAEVTASGAHVVVATGRCMRTADDYGFAGVDCEVVCANGSMVLDRVGHLIHHETVSPAFVEELLRAFPTIPFDFTCTDGTYVTATEAEHARSMSRMSPMKRIIMRGMRGIAASGGDVFNFGATPADVLSREVCKVNCRVPDDGLTRELEAFVAEHASEVVNAPFNPEMFEITDARTNKGASVAWLASYLGIEQDEVAVYGDGGNDVAMLARFAPYGHAYAPSGASVDAKAAASEVIGPCLLHAVAHHMVRTVRTQASVPSSDARGGRP